MIALSVLAHHSVNGGGQDSGIQWFEKCVRGLCAALRKSMRACARARACVCMNACVRVCTRIYTHHSIVNIWSTSDIDAYALAATQANALSNGVRPVSMAALDLLDG